MVTSEFTRSIRVGAWAGVLICGLAATAAMPAQEARTGRSSSEAYRSGILDISSKPPEMPYCGVYCLFALFNLYGIDVKVEDLLKPAYVGSQDGSTFAELERAARDYGMYAEPVARLGIQELAAAKWPLILHTQSDAAAESFNHYELLLSTKNGEALLYSPPGVPRWVSLDALIPRWNGKALIVSPAPITLWTLLLPARLRLGAVALAVSAGIAGLIGLLSRRKTRIVPGTILRRLRRAGAECLALTLAATGFAAAYHCTAQNGFLARSKWVRAVQERHKGAFLPKVPTEEFAERSRNSVLVDARFPQDFEAGHVKGAISVPVNSGLASVRGALSGVGKDTPIIVYCQSKACQYDEKVAFILIKEGFTNTSILRVGWVELQQAHLAG